MKKNLLMLGAALMCYSGSFAQKCGMQAMHEAMIAKDPVMAQRLNEQRNSLQTRADNYMLQQAAGANHKATAISAIPVIFHIVLNASQLAAIGGEAGVARLCDSQIRVLNRDYNRENADSTAIPSGWKSIYGNAGIRFGFAHTDPTGHSTPGYEIKVITNNGFSNMDDAFPEAKTAATGLASWDVNKYLNIWCLNFTGAASTLLGIAVPQSQTGWGGYPVDEMGVCIFYKVLGKTKPGDGTYNPPYNNGRTLTHEVGHFFEIWHTWGDDNGNCPWDGGQDDGIADTPPQSDAVYGNPSYTVLGGTNTDGCKLNGSTDVQPVGVACLSFMDYTDDNAMHMFTNGQASAMASHVLVSSGEHYSLTQHPELLNFPLAVTNVAENTNLNIYPNPATGQINISFNTSETLNEIMIFNLMGQQVTKLDGQGKDYYSIDLSGMSKGIYFVKCNFASGSVTRKILLQ